MPQTWKACITIAEIFARFIGSAIFGGFISLVILFLVFFLGLYGFFTSTWKHTLWAIPVVWGILGIFHFDKMLDLARDIFESHLRE